MDTGIVVALIGLGGISLGAFLAGLGYYLKSRTERLKNKKLVLYHLLEIRTLVKAAFADPKEITESYLNYCESFFRKNGFIDDNKISDNLKAIIEQHLSNILVAMTPKIDDVFAQSFESALTELCKTDPILAFKLRGKDRVGELLHSQKSYTESFSNFIQPDTNMHLRDFASRQMSNASSSATESLIRDFDKDILEVAWGCSVITWFYCLRITKAQSKPSVSFEGSGIDQLLEKIFFEIVREINESNLKSDKTVEAV